MATFYDRIAGGPVRHKRKGIPMRSPCQRDMVEAPGVVFRFPDKISSSPELKPVVPGLNILPFSAGLPSGNGAKSAAAVIAAAAAVSAAGSPTLRYHALLPSSTIVAATSNAPATTTITAATIGALTTAAAANAAQAAHTTATADLLRRGDAEVETSSTFSTPILRPTGSAVPIHRSASNVLHYPELLSDLRDKLMQVHQISHHNSTSTSNNAASSGVESDENHTIKRVGRGKRAGKSTAAAAAPASRGSGSSPGPAPGSAVGGRGSSVLRTTLRSRHETGAAAAAAAEAASGGAPSGSATASSASPASIAFQRRHSIGTIQSQADEDEDSEIVVDDDGDAGAAANVVSAPTQHVQHAPTQQQQQRSQVGAAAKRHPKEGGRASSVGNKARRASAEASAETPRVTKRKRDAKEDTADHRSRSPAAKRPSLQLPVAEGGSIPAAASLAAVSKPANFNSNPSRRSCASCGSCTTPCWRPGLIDSMTLCNLCGLRFKKGNVYCGSCSYVPTKTEIATGGASACKRCLLPIRMNNVNSASAGGAIMPSPLVVLSSSKKNAVAKVKASAANAAAAHAAPRVILPNNHSSAIQRQPQNGSTPQQQQQQQTKHIGC
ncbi:DNA-binding transcription repressor [Kickxella alabastrina]|uniref:DNA-binding transcription repressor n=1 Tax=Kickxella alabastrina TaxID=61397 RepID=A0ACC1IIZ9_9FUNG|nr:DNA-binding transcription repressor [Kickxella alabastrina]